MAHILLVKSLAMSCFWSFVGYFHENAQQIRNYYAHRR